ncbi:MAG: glycosyltransferase family 1 protein, partial [Candidatus Rokuibacteriota bacterium]
FQELLRHLPEARLLLVGKGESRSALEADVANLGLANRVLFAGYRDRDLPGVLAALDCFVLMAAGSDDSCRAVLEAMAAGCPVVARRVGALPETIVQGETGLLLDDDRPQTIARALEGVLRDPARARAMGAAGQRRAQAEFTPARYVDAVERIYRTVLDRV